MFDHQSHTPVSYRPTSDASLSDCHASISANYVRSIAIVTLLIVSAVNVPTADAQFHARKGLQFGVKVGASGYNGDDDFVLPGENRYSLSYEGELFYRFSRWFGLGVKQSFGKYPGLSSTKIDRSSSALAVRSYLFPSRFTPYVQVGANRSWGGVDPGYGIALSTGFEIEVSRFLAIYQDISFDQVMPDGALDGAEGGRRYDVFGRLGAGLRLNLVSSRRALRIARVNQPDSLLVGEVGQFTAVVDGSARDASYRWELPGGVIYDENPIRHSFPSPGRYEMRLTVTSHDEQQLRSVFVDVYRPFVPDTVGDYQESLKAVRIAGLSGDTSLRTGEEGVFRMRIETGAEWPIEYAWDMGDGSAMVGNYVVHVFDNPGVYRVRASARNAFGEDEAEMTVEVLRNSDTAISQKAPTEAVIAEPVRPEPAPLSADDVAPELPPVVEDTDDTPATELAVTDTKRTPVADPNPNRNISRIDFNASGYTWVVETVDTASEAATRAEEYKYLGFPFGYRRDRATGKYNVLVGQFETEYIALKVSWRIQQHAARRIWLDTIK